MVFWVALALVMLVAVGLIAWGVRDIGDRAHKPGTQYLNRPTKNRPTKNTR
jgi:hypothetical protein